MAGNRTVKRSVEIIEFIAKSESGASLKDIVDGLKIPKTSAYDIIRELVSTGMLVEKRGEVNTFRIGLKAFQIGNEYLNETDLITVARPIVKVMAEQTCKTAFIAVMSEGFVTYIYKYEPKTSIITTSNIGTKNPVHCTSLGKAILSGMSCQERLRELKGLSLTPFTAHTITDMNTLLEDIEEAARRGYAIDNREIEDHTMCIGAPIFNHENKVIAGLSVSGFYSKDRNIAFEGGLIRKAALDISNLLGYGGRDGHRCANEYQDGEQVVPGDQRA